MNYRLIPISVVVLLTIAGSLRGTGVPTDALPVKPAPARDAASPAVEALGAELERLIESPGWRDDVWSVQVVSMDRGDTLFSHGPDQLLAPASNMKLYTSVAALYFLGPEFRFSTYLLTRGPVANGVLDGDVIVYGTGDPTLSGRLLGSKTQVFEAFADSLRAAGIREVRGAVIGDGSYFTGTGSGTGWDESYINASYAAPAGALSVGENILTLRISGSAPGAPPTIVAVPGGEGLAIDNQARTVARGRTTISAGRMTYDGPIVVRGQIARGSAVTRTLPAANPAQYAAAVLREQIEKRGIRVTGGIRSTESADQSAVTGQTVFAPAFDDGPRMRVLAVHRSPRLLEILEVVNKDSHNFFAEQVLRAVGRVAVDDGSAEGGARAVQHLLTTETALDSGVVQMYDGSGLSRLNRVTARSTIHLLGYAAQSNLWESLWYTLPEAGSRDLRRMRGTAAESNMRAKTGTIDRVSALSGYVRGSDGERLAFSIISNNVPSTWKAKRIEDEIVVRLASFSRPGGATVAAGTPAVASPPAAVKPKPAPAPAAAAPAAPAAARTHTIRRGDTLEGIAKKYGTTVAKLTAANPGVTPRRLMPGKTLKLP